jgi:hypothetical protein
MRVTSNTKLETNREKNNYSKFSFKSPTQSSGRPLDFTSNKPSIKE